MVACFLALEGLARVACDCLGAVRVPGSSSSWQSDALAVAALMVPKSWSKIESPEGCLAWEASSQEMVCQCAPVEEKEACSAC